MKTKKYNFNLGGQAIASGGFGCVFLPPLKCKGDERPTGKVVSKLLTTLNAADEFNEAKDIQTMLQTNLSVDIYNRFFIFPEKLCEPDALTKDDLTNFEQKCSNLTKVGITANTINKNLDAVRIIELTNGGSDLKNMIKQMKTINELSKLNKSIIELLTSAVVPMNRLGILHFDLKSPNILVGDDYQLRLIDWGLSVISKNNKIPSGSTMRPIQYNLPFSTVLFNKKIINEINNDLKKIHFDVNYKEAIKPELSAIIHKIVVKHFKNSDRGHIGFVSDNIKKLFNITGEKDFFIHNLLTNYLTEAVINFINPQTLTFDDTKYFNDVCMKNCDVWGLITVYNDIVNHADILGAGRSQQVKQLRLLVMRYLYSPEFAGKPIDVDILIKELKNIMPFSSTTKKVNVVNKSTGSKEKNVQDPVSTSSVNYSPATKKVNDIKPKSKSVDNKKTGVIDLVSSDSIVPLPVKKKTRRKRCKNGTRRNKKTGECEDKNKARTPNPVTEPVVAEPVVQSESSDYTGSLLERMGLVSKPETNNPVVKKQKVVIGEKKVTNMDKNTRKRCKNGTRRNKKTGECENINGLRKSSINRDTSEPTTSETETETPSPTNETETETETPSPINETDTDTSNLLNDKQNPETAEPPSLLTRLGF